MVVVRETDVAISECALVPYYAERTVEVLRPDPATQTARRSMRGTRVKSGEVESEASEGWCALPRARSSHFFFAISGVSANRA